MQQKNPSAQRAPAAASAGLQGTLVATPDVAADLHSVRVTIEHVAPEQAAEWLATARPNRHLSKPLAGFYARQIKEGLWHFAGEPLIFDVDDALINGQHRLAAIIDSGQALDVLIVRGVSTDAMAVVDTGKTRTGADTMAILRPEVYDAKTTAAAVRTTLLWQEQSNPFIRGKAGRLRYGNLELVDHSFDYPELADCVRAAKRLHRLGIPGGDGFWSALLLRFSRLDAVAADEFATQLGSGAGMQEGDPILVLRNHLLSMYRREVRPHPSRTAGWVLRGWNAYRRGETSLRLRWADAEKLPFPI